MPGMVEGKVLTEFWWGNLREGDGEDLHLDCGVLLRGFLRNRVGP